MRVLHIIDTLWIGGAQTLERDYFEMQKDNPDVFLYVLRRSEPQITIDHKNVFIYDSYKRYSFLPVFKLKKIIEENKIDIVHCHLLRSQLFGYLVKRLFFPAIKLVVHEQGDLVDASQLSVPILKLIKRRVNLFVTCSDALKNLLEKKANIEPGKVIRLYNAINLRKFNRQAITWDVIEEKGKTGIGENDFVVGFAARLIERKGWREFVELARIFLADTSVKFLIAGDGPDREQLLHLISEYELSNIIYMGYTSNIQLFYSMIDCLIVPSHHEPMGMIVPEAQAMGVPVIAANVDGLNEIVTNGENALLFTAKDVQGMKSALLRVLEDKSLHRDLISNGLSNAEKYSIQNYAKALNEIYTEVMKHA